MTLQASKQADKAARRREQPTAEDRKRALQKKRREEREARELAEAHAHAKVVSEALGKVLLGAVHGVVASCSMAAAHCVSGVRCSEQAVLCELHA